MARVACLALIAALFGVLVGCSSPGDEFKADPNKGLSSKERMQKTIDSINANPNIPPAAKEKAIAAAMAHSGAQ
jgi:hypothetical protein